MAGLSGFIRELRRRNVFRVGVAYAVVSWLIIQVVETLFPVFGLGDAAIRVVVTILVIGFIPALISAWAFELTPEGLKRDHEVDQASPVSRQMAKRLDRVIMVFLALALGYLAFDKFVLAPDREATVAEEARQAGRTEALVESYGDKSIAVLPFTDMSPSGDQAYFADGISEELLNLLARLKDLRVISRSSSFALRDDGLSTPEVADRLNVAYVLEGSVRKDADKVRITAQLIDARSDTHLWSKTYDRTLEDVFAIQGEISAQVVDALKITILGSAPAVGPTSSAAYELYLQGLGEFATREDIPRAIELFEQVIAIDPDYASAYASLALALIWSDEHVSVRDPRLEATVNRALALDPGNSDALAALGRLRNVQNRLKEGRELLDQAIANNPNNAFAYRWLGTSYTDADPVRYYALSRKAYEVNPLDPTIRYHLALAASMLGRYDDALAAAQGLPPGFGDQMAGNVHHHFGHLDRSLKSFYRAYRTWESFGALPRELMMMKEYDLVEAWLLEGGPLHARANLAAIRGEPDKAFRLYADENEQAPDANTDWTVGWAHIRFTGDFDAARESLERYLLEPGQTVSRFDPDHWAPFIEYALALQRTGSPERAAELIGDIRVFIETRVAAGVVRDAFDLNFQFWLSALHAMSGDTQQAIAALRHAAPQGGLTCTHCVRMWPHWDNLRGEPEFDRVLAEVEADKEVQRQRLADEGMLLTPEEVLQLEEFSFDPFLN